MPQTQIYELRPTGLEDAPEEERLPFSTLDYLIACTYMNYALFFQLDDDKQRPSVIEILKKGIERTLGQCTHLVGRVEKYNDDLFFVRRKDSTVKFIVNQLDSEADGFPHFSDLKQANFASSALGDFNRLSVDDMTYGEKPSSSPNAEPVIAAFQANFVPGGLIFNSHIHHCANDAAGWASFMFQLAENCFSNVNKTQPPSWDPSCLDLSRFTAQKLPDELMVDGPEPPTRHEDLPEDWTLLLFHLPKSKATKLKKIATPEDKSWISTYDAVSAFLWRTVTRHRVDLYHTNMNAVPIWGETVDLRNRLSPPVPSRVQRNLIYAAASMLQPEQLNVREITSEVPLSRLAAYIRRLTNSATTEAVDQYIQMQASVRDKTRLFVRVNSFPPLSIVMIDWRHATVCDADFGFGKPMAFRQLYSAVTEGTIVIYPQRPSEDPDEGLEIVIHIEASLEKSFLEDTEMQEFFEFRGYERNP